MALIIPMVWAGIITAEEPRVSYNQDIRPILAEACFHCHGPDSASRKADLRLDQREPAVELGAISPGAPDASELLRRVESDDHHEQMPPPETKKVLTAEQKQMLRRWIEQGAEYQPHWSFIPPQRPALPEVENTEWARNPIDRFILEALEANGLTPAPEADLRTLARRAALDLTGLPPTPEQVQALLEDKSPDAYERYVDELLASPAWGEHRAHYWLDYARYADTNGIHFDNFREMWSYRDWVIEAFNSNMPYDQFTVENIAGDLIPNATLAQQIGSGFNRCNPTTNENGIIDEEYLVLYARDRVETTAQVWMGLTAGCAVCHTHKFDPISQKEFYQLAAFFNNHEQTAKDGNRADTPPTIVVPRMEDRAAWASLQHSLVKIDASLERRRKAAESDFRNWLTVATPDLIATQLPDRGQQFHVSLNGDINGLVTDDEPLSIDQMSWADGPQAGTRSLEIASRAKVVFPNVGDFNSDQPFSISVWVQLPETGSGTILSKFDDRDGKRTGWEIFIGEGRRPGLRISGDRQQEIRGLFRAKKLASGMWIQLVVTYDGLQAGSGIRIYDNGRAEDMAPVLERITTDTRNNVPLRIGGRESGPAFQGLKIADLRIYDRVLNEYEIQALGRQPALMSMLIKDTEERTSDEMAQLRNWYLSTLDQEFRSLVTRRDDLLTEQRRIQSLGTIAHVMQDRKSPPIAHVLSRGEYDQREEEVGAETPQFLPPFPDDLSRNRLGFAHWLLQPDQPLTARVTVNRCWQEVFGTGIVKTSGDFGVMGELPSHQELLDWLAVEFREQGWDLKQLYRLMLTSASYRQAAILTAERIEKDPDNRLLSRGPRFRMDAEMIRDYLLATSGVLIPQIGGPSVRPYQPPGVWEAVGMQGSNTRHYVQGSDDELYRRSLYTFVKRMAPPASMELFNSPNREVCTIRRERTNTPLQALVLLNDTQSIEAARVLAEEALGPDSITDEDRLQWVGQKMLLRDFSSREIDVLLASLNRLRSAYSDSPELAEQFIEVGDSQPDRQFPPCELAAWAAMVNQLFNLDEVLNK